MNNASGRLDNFEHPTNAYASDVFAMFGMIPFNAVNVFLNQYSVGLSDSVTDAVPVAVMKFVVAQSVLDTLMTYVPGEAYECVLSSVEELNVDVVPSPHSTEISVDSFAVENGAEVFVLVEETFVVFAVYWKLRFLSVMIESFFI